MEVSVKEILQPRLPVEMAGDMPRLPGIAPCGAADWLRVDEAYGAQMAYRRALLKDPGAHVLYLEEAARPAAQEVLGEALALLPRLGFHRSDGGITCPDGHVQPLDFDNPLRTLGQIVQEDICLLQKRGDEHVLTGAVLCFPASWRLADKAGRPLIGIHDTVPEYDSDIARRVQRLFDGVRPGRPLWRFNRLAYADPDLHQPYRTRRGEARPYLRSERQCILRLPETNAAVFTIHTWVLRRGVQEADDEAENGAAVTAP
ncbi:hypothetical protein A3728_17310 [Sulfitobacter sp. HI0040]|nr:hypothetical protein A3721_03345 [Sulfitobacter sp. HI0023]KZY26007.1 hypothetical protein A3728_17310 [Sulfitobacter sp. HI0040]KZZ68201.1 hypothetical protein A3764_13475 [Sulfitobacter sp. HI0129]